MCGAPRRGLAAFGSLCLCRWSCESEEVNSDLSPVNICAQMSIDAVTMDLVHVIKSLLSVLIDFGLSRACERVTVPCGRILMLNLLLLPTFQSRTLIFHNYNSMHSLEVNFQRSPEVCRISKRLGGLE